MIDRRAVIRTLAFFAVPVVAKAQQAGKTARIGYLGVNRPEDIPHLLEALRLGLREHGWVEGQNIQIEYRWAEGMPDRLTRLVGELVRLNVDLIIAPATQAIQAAKHATSTIPIVMVASNDPVSDEFVASLARPGRNITGLTLEPGPEIGEKQVELLRETMPRLSRVRVLTNPANRAHSLMSASLRSAARSLGLQLEFFEAQSPDEIDRAFVVPTNVRAGALLVHSDAMLFGQRRRIAELAARSRLPVIYPWRDAAEVGGLISYGASLRDNFRRSASFVDRILKGAKPTDLPVERPTKFEMVINLKTAKALGLKIPTSLMVRADQVIE